MRSVYVVQQTCGCVRPHFCCAVAAFTTDAAAFAFACQAGDAAQRLKRGQKGTSYDLGALPCMTYGYAEMKPAKSVRGWMQTQPDKYVYVKKHWGVAVKKWGKDEGKGCGRATPGVLTLTQYPKNPLKVMQALKEEQAELDRLQHRVRTLKK